MIVKSHIENKAGIILVSAIAIWILTSVFHVKFTGVMRVESGIPITWGFLIANAGQVVGQVLIIYALSLFFINARFFKHVADAGMGWGVADILRLFFMKVFTFEPAMYFGALFTSFILITIYRATRTESGV